jgi:hypothetical protein
VKITYQHNLLHHPYALDFFIAVHFEHTIVNISILLPFVSVIYAHDNWEVLSDVLIKAESHQIVEVEVNPAKLNLLVHAWFKADFLNVVRLVWSEKHLRYIICVLLLSHASVYSNNTLSESIYFEFNAKHVLSSIFVNFLYNKISQK